MSKDLPAAGLWANPVSGACPVAETLRMLGSKHAAIVLHCLTSGEMHFLELSRNIPGISRKVLTEQLRDFEQNGLILRQEKQDARKRVGYSLSPKGQALGAILQQLYDWDATFNPS